MAQFEKGRSGNPSGRRPGTSAAQKLARAIADDMPDVISTLVNLAKGGDVDAAKLLLDRTVPPLKPTVAPVRLDLDPAAPHSAQTAAIVDALAHGALAPDIAVQLLSALAASRPPIAVRSEDLVHVYLPEMDPEPDDD